MMGRDWGLSLSSPGCVGSALSSAEWREWLWLTLEVLIPPRQTHVGSDLFSYTPAREPGFLYKNGP